MNWQRFSVGVFALGFLICGGLLHVAKPADAAGYVGILVRVGLLLSVIWLALPQLEQLKTRLSGMLLLGILLLLVVVAARPNLSRVAAGILAITLAANWILKWLSRFTHDQANRK